MKNTPSFYIVFQLLQVTHKHLWDKPPDPISRCFMLVFTSADIIFYKLLELHSSLSVKKIFVTNCPFLRDSLKHLHPPKSQNLLSVTTVFRQCSFIALFFSEQEPPWSFLPNSAKRLRLAHEPSQSLIRICQFVTIMI